MSNPRNATATEVDARQEEKFLQLGPVLERVNDEQNDPMLDIVFDEMDSRGMFPDPPAEIAGMNLKVEYVSILAQAQKIIATAGIDRFAGFVTGMAQFKPEVLDKFDIDESVDQYGDALGVSARMIRDDDTVDDMREERAEAQAAAERLAVQRESVTAAKEMSETDTTGKNALTDVLGAGVAGV
jgi:hypothetical protein